MVSPHRTVWLEAAGGSYGFAADDGAALWLDLEPG